MFSFFRSSLTSHSAQPAPKNLLPDNEGKRILNEGFEVFYALNGHSDRIHVTGYRNDLNRKIVLLPHLILGETETELMSLNDYINSRKDLLLGADLTNLNLASIDLSNQQLLDIYASHAILHTDDLVLAWRAGAKLKNADLIAVYYAGAKLDQDELIRLYRTETALRYTDMRAIVPRIYQYRGETEILSVQSKIRQFNITGIPEEKGWVSALRQPKVDAEGKSDGQIGKAIAYEVLPGQEDRFPFKALPDEDKNIPKHQRPQGSFKRLDYVNQQINDPHNPGQKMIVPAEFVGMTLLYREQLGRQDAATYKPDVIHLINDQKLTQFVIQYRIDAGRMMAVNLGPSLAALAQSKTYQHKLSAFVLLAKQVTLLHEAGYAHRDFKPDNMHFDKHGNVCVPDLDSIQKIITITNEYGTSGYVHQSLQDGFYDEHQALACKVDQYEILVSIIEMIFPEMGLVRTGEINRKDCQNEFNQFINSLPCIDTLKKEVENFLTNPRRYRLSFPLENYIQSPDDLA